MAHTKAACTITYGDAGENHVGMQKIGCVATEGFTHEDLLRAELWAKSAGCATELIDLCPASGRSDCSAAWVLVIRNGVNALLHTNTADDMLAEMQALVWDKHALMYGRVVNKHARHNLCFADNAQVADYAAGKGTVVAFKDVTCVQTARQSIAAILGDVGSNLIAEGNLYYDADKCGIGYHGDAERRKVIALRLGASIPLRYCWFLNGAAIGYPVDVTLHHGDMYIMSSKAVGWDWKTKKIPTLRHAAGCDKYVRVPAPKRKRVCAEL